MSSSSSKILTFYITQLLIIYNFSVFSMVKKWKVCQIKNVLICVIPLPSKYYCYLWNIFWWKSQGDYAVNSYTHWWKIINLHLDKFFHKECLEAVVCRCPVKKVFFIKIHRKSLRPATLLKKETLAQVFSREFWKILKNTFFYRTPPVAASECSNKSKLF